jgi:hypothetical protein
MSPVWKKIIKIGVPGLAGSYGLGWVFCGLQAKKLVPQITPKVYAVSTKGIDLRVKLAVKNPTAIHFSMLQPTIKVHFNGSEIFTTDPSKKRTVIPAHGTGTLDEIPIKMELLESLHLGSLLLDSILGKKEIGFTLETKVNLRALGIFPYSQTITTEVPINFSSLIG